MSKKHFDDLHHLTSNDTSAFWHRVNRLIKERKLTQEQVAEAINVNYGTFRGWSHYKTYPNLFDIHHLAQALDTTMNYLIFGTDEEHQDHPANVIGNKILELVKIISTVLKKSSLF